jgi:hypothetical protein
MYPSFPVVRFAANLLCLKLAKLTAMRKRSTKSATCIKFKQENPQRSRLDVPKISNGSEGQHAITFLTE